MFHSLKTSTPKMLALTALALALPTNAANADPLSTVVLGGAGNTISTLAKSEEKNTNATSVKSVVSASLSDDNSIKVVLGGVNTAVDTTALSPRGKAVSVSQVGFADITDAGDTVTITSVYNQGRNFSGTTVNTLADGRDKGEASSLVMGTNIDGYSGKVTVRMAAPGVTVNTSALSVRGNATASGSIGIAIIER